MPLPPQQVHAQAGQETGGFYKGAPDHIVGSGTPHITQESGVRRAGPLAPHLLMEDARWKFPPNPAQHASSMHMSGVRGGYEWKLGTDNSAA